MKFGVMSVVIIKIMNSVIVLFNIWFMKDFWLEMYGDVL